MEIAKELKKCKWTRFSRHREKTFQQDCGTQVQHPPAPFPPLRAVACKRLLFHKYKVSFLYHTNLHFTLAVT